MDNKNDSKYFIPNPGDRIGDAVIIEPIAEGGMARIFKVKNEALEVIRVIKLMKADLDIDADRFVTEARISAKLNHPNIVQCYYFGKFKDTIPYIEMEYVDGTNLYKLIYKQGKLPVPVTASIIYFVCKALNVLHHCHYTLYNVKRSGIVHRDIKPANILLSRSGEVKLADFGIAKPKDLSIHTAAIQIVGSTFYLSPEQLRKEPLDFKTDIYSLGCVMYEMVTAQKAFSQNNISDIVVAKLNNTYSTSLLYRCPEHLKRIIVKCLNPKKSERYNKIEEVQTEIESIIQEYTINDPQQIIHDYIQNPRSFSHPAPFIEKKKKYPLYLKYVILVFVISLFTAYGLLVLRGKKSIDHELPILSKPLFFKRDIDSLTKVIVGNKDSVVSLKQEMVKTDQNKTKLSTRPRLTKTKRKGTRINTHILASEAFNQKNYSQCISLLSNKANTLNDTLFLYLLGSFTETNNFSQLSKYIFLRSIDDGYYHYVQGRLAFSNNQYSASINHFLHALTVQSFFNNLSFYIHYYLSKSKFSLFQKTPNNQNKVSVITSFERFIARFCKNPGLSECQDITSLYQLLKEGN